MAKVNGFFSLWDQYSRWFCHQDLGFLGLRKRTSLVVESVPIGDCAEGSADVVSSILIKNNVISVIQSELRIGRRKILRVDEVGILL